jgi:hypothetical protein
MELSPGLKPRRRRELAAAYGRARETAADETGLPIDLLPATCPYSLEEVVGDDFWPGEPWTQPR